MCLIDCISDSDDAISDTGGSSTPSDKGNGSSSLSTGTIAGIATGSVVAVAGIVGAIFRYLSYRNKKKTGGASGREGNNDQVVRYQPAWQVGLPASVFAGNANGSAVYTRNEFTWTLTSGIHRTRETYNIGRQPTPPAAIPLGQGRVLGEV